jgi:hypothetical protein
MKNPPVSRSRADSSVVIRPMQESDVPELLRLMRALVSFEPGQDFRLGEAAYDTIECASRRAAGSTDGDKNGTNVSRSFAPPAVRE